jgi:CRISPR-associated protein Csb2
VTTVFDERMVILRLEPAPPESRWLELATTLALTSTLRKAILGRCSTPIPESISGHSAEGGASQQPHMALVPLGFVDHTYADGHLLGVGVVLPRGADKTVERQLAEALERLADSGEQYGEGLGFDRKAFPGLGQWRLIQEGPLSEFRSNLRANTWTAAERGGCMRWASVTPVGYDQHGKAKDRAAYLAECSASIEEAVRRVIPTEINVSVRITPVSAFEGVPAARDFPRMKRKDGSERRQTHVELFFDRPVVGPLLIGAGRFRGYGLCRPCNGEDD